MDEELADPEEVYDDQAKIGGEKEAEDVESSKGSAWPSETSRLTPHQSVYQMKQMNQKIAPPKVQQSLDLIQSQTQIT